MWEILLANVLLTAAAVWIHYEALHLMADRMMHLTQRRRIHLLMSVFGAIFAHWIEIAMYGLAFYLLTQSGDLGTLVGGEGSSLSDCFYFSISNYTSLGMGDIRPSGPLRFVAGFEALTGLVLITWTASFLFLEMQKIWNRNNCL
ncbi:MAG: ion channel [bacterium]